MTQPRVFGLDLLRAAAITVVLVANTIFFFQIQLPALSGLAPVIGFFGLESFLVLSGFLMARALYPVFTTAGFGFRDSLRFIRQRLGRIAPLYFIVISVNIALAAVMDYPFAHAWKYFLFAQNFASPIPAFFPESWGLPVILWASLFFVLLLFGLSRIVLLRHRAIAFGAAAILLALIFSWTKWLRHSVYGTDDLAHWEAGLRTVVIYRIDSVMIGVIAGWLWLFKNALIQKIKWFLFAAGLIGLLFFAVGVGYLNLQIQNYPLFWAVLYLPMASATIACFLPLLSSWERSAESGVAVLMSKASYSIYLTHFSIVLLLLEHFFLRDAVVANNIFILALVYFGGAILFGYLVYQFIEKRLQRLPHR